MPKRMIDTAIWSDERITELTPHAQLVYFRLILGDDTTAAGSTRVKAKRIAVDTNLTATDVDQAITQLVACDLVRAYDDGWLWLPSFIKYQLAGPPFIAAIRREAKRAPEALNRAITRALDARVGPQKHTPKTPEPGKKPKTRSDAEPTTKAAPSREEPNPHTIVTEPSANLTREVPVPVPVPGQSFGLSVLVGEATLEAAGPGQPEGRPAAVGEGRNNGHVQVAENPVYGDRKSELAAFHQHAAGILEHLRGANGNGRPGLTVIPGGDQCDS